MENMNSLAESKASESIEARHVASREIFDDIARTLGSDIPRRRALALVLKGLLGAALAEFGIKSAWAQATCLCQGQTYDPLTACCTPTGVQQKHPISSTRACPNKVPHPGFVALPNGCGPSGGALTPVIPNGFGAASFLQCCNTHDICYGTCNDVKDSCDGNFLACLVGACDAAYSGTGILDGIKRNSCRSVANTYFGAVHHFGDGAFEAAQDEACDCCGTSTCPQSCAGSACGSLPPCAPGGDCLCFTSTEGSGACVHGATPCASVSRCTTTADCPSGTTCLTTSCCGSFGVCGPLCNPILPSAFIAPRSRTGGPTLGGL